ncbi:MAG: serine/threonine protein kinase [Deltaproteobacteria bacterium]|nr:serine/threonine protein kinase [Deltaproteobacteria bacterium]
MKLPAQIGRYQVVGHLATGGMAEILLGKLLGPSGFERAVVIKRILPHLAMQEKFVQMFLDEARIVARIRHPSVVHVHELGRDDEELFLVMEYLEGENAGSLMRRTAARAERVEPALAAHVIGQACAGLQAAHELTDEDGRRQNLVHRDVSPQNIFLTYGGEVKVLDFGIAHVANRMTRTEAGQMKGKFTYMSPEQCRGQPLDRRSDVFGLGIVLFELLTCRRLFARPSEMLVLEAICKEPVPAPSRIVRGLPESLDAICAKSLARRPADRYATTAEMRRDLVSAIREMDVHDPPEEALAVRMRLLFEDRIAQKREMLRRVRAGSSVPEVPAADLDTPAELPSVVSEAGGVTVETQLSGEMGGERSSLVPSRRRRWLAAALLAGLAGAGAYAVVLPPWERSRPPSRLDDAPTLETHGPRVDERGNDPAPTAPPAPAVDREEPIDPAPALTPAPAADVVIHIETSPAGATVLLGHEPRGVTPIDLRVPRSRDPVDLQVRREGYVPWSDEIRPDVDQRLRLVLSKKSRARSTPRSPSGFHRFD